MGGYIARQPNGLFCRFSTSVDCITHYNMTADEYIEYCIKNAVDEAIQVANRELEKPKSFENCIDQFVPDNVSQEEFDQIVKECETAVKVQLYRRKARLSEVIKQIEMMRDEATLDVCDFSSEGRYKEAHLSERERNTFNQVLALIKECD